MLSKKNNSIVGNKTNESTRFLNELSDRDIDELVSCLWENIEGLPYYVQEVMKKADTSTAEGQVLAAIAVGWVTGKLDWNQANPWVGGKSGWVATKDNVN
jgi:hypothetical protein